MCLHNAHSHYLVLELTCIIILYVFVKTSIAIFLLNIDVDGIARMVYYCGSFKTK